MRGFQQLLLETGTNSLNYRDKSPTPERQRSSVPSHPNFQVLSHHGSVRRHILRGQTVAAGHFIEGVSKRGGALLLESPPIGRSTEIEP